MPAQSAYGMWLVLDRQAPTCLERALLLQEWRSAHGVRTDVLIGVPAEGLGSRDIHAWVEGSRDVDASSYQIIHRVAARAA